MFSLCSCTLTGACLNVFFCFQHHGERSLSKGEEGGGGELSGWAHSERAKWRDGGGREGGLSGRSHRVARV